jgi:hypothetical protein
MSPFRAFTRRLGDGGPYGHKHEEHKCVHVCVCVCVWPRRKHTSMYSMYIHSSVIEFIMARHIRGAHTFVRRVPGDRDVLATLTSVYVDGLNKTCIHRPSPLTHSGNLYDLLRLVIIGMHTLNRAGLLNTCHSPSCSCLHLHT